MPPLNSDKRTQPTSIASTGWRAHTLLVVFLLVGVGFLGCGESSAHHPEIAASRARATKFKPIVHETHADIVAAVSACRQGVNIAYWLSQANKEDLYATCDKGLRRGLTEVKQWGSEVCSEVSYTSPAKNVAEKARVFSECYAGTKVRTTVAPGP
jgi:hypothetical protein